MVKRAEHVGKSECLLVIRRIEVNYTQPERVLTSYTGANNKKGISDIISHCISLLHQFGWKYKIKTVIRGKVVYLKDSQSLRY
jgi:hypothetical protein